MIDSLEKVKYVLHNSKLSLEKYFQDVQIGELFNDQNFILKNDGKSILDISLNLASLSFAQKLKYNEIDNDVKQLLYKSFSEVYQPRITLGQGNCLWNMVSLCLCGNESLMITLRWMTAICLVLIQQDIKKLLKLDLSLTEGSDTKLDRLVETKFQKLLRDAFTAGSWGNEYHLLSISTFLGRNLFIYSTFKKDKKFILDENVNAEILNQEFKAKSLKIGHHLAYKPLKNEIFPENKNENLYGFFCSKKSHYSALIPILKDSIVFIPFKNLFEFR